jgi:hypothetical protein
VVLFERDAWWCVAVTVDKELFADTLPTYLTRFVGRDREIATVLSILHPGRLATICGVGGAVRLDWLSRLRSAAELIMGRQTTVARCTGCRSLP